MTKQEAVKALAQMVADARAARDHALQECQALADAHGLAFTWDDTYGSRQQTYEGKGMPLEYQDEDDWYSSTATETTPDGTKVRAEGGWVSSSEHC